MIAFTVGCVVSLTVPSGQGNSAIGSPRAEIVDWYLDAGDHSVQTTFVAHTKVCNAGSGMLVVRALRTDCPCVEAALDRQGIEPNACGVLSISVETRENYGHQRHWITLKTNDPIAPKQKIRLDYRVGMPIRVVPVHLWLGVLPPGAEDTTDVEVASTLGHAGGIVRVVCDDPLVNADILAARITKESPGKIIIRVNASNDSRVLEASVKVFTTLPDAAILHVPVRAVVTPSLRAELRSIDLGEIFVGETAHKMVPIGLEDGYSLEIQRCWPRRLSAYVEAKRESGVELRIAYSADQKVGPAQGTITLFLKGSKPLRFNVPVSWKVVPPTLEPPLWQKQWPNRVIRWQHQ